MRVVILRAEGRGFNAGVDIKEIQAKGQEALIGVNRGCFEAFAAVYECAVPVIAAVHGLLPRRRYRPDRQRRRDRRQRGRDLRAARGRPRRARRRHPPLPARPPAPGAGDDVHLGDRHGGRAARVRLGPARRPARAAARGGARGRGRDRRQGPDRDPRRPRSRSTASTSGTCKAQLPLRAGLHLRAEPAAASPTGPRRVRPARAEPWTSLQRGRGGLPRRGARLARGQRAARAAVRRHRGGLRPAPRVGEARCTRRAGRSSPGRGPTAAARRRSGSG